MCLARQGFAYKCGRGALGGRFDGGPKTGPAGADNYNVMCVCFIFFHVYINLRSVIVPFATRNT